MCVYGGGSGRKVLLALGVLVGRTKKSASFPILIKNLSFHGSSSCIVLLAVVVGAVAPSVQSISLDLVGDKLRVAGHYQYVGRVDYIWLWIKNG